MKRRQTRRSWQQRRGVIAVLSIFLMAFMVGMVAFAVDLGGMLVARTQLQQSADSAALAAASELVDNNALTGSPNLSTEIASARSKAVQYAAANLVVKVSPTIDPNASNSTSGDVVIGYLANPSDRTQSMSFTNMNIANAVQVRVRRSTASNGEVPLFFGRIFGITSRAMEATATAAILTNFGGLKAPSDGSNLSMLPFALQVDSWNNLLAGHGNDRWSWDPTNQRLSHGSDGILEVNLYPDSTNSPGNVGTVDIGASSNSTSDIARQILSGISPSDLAALPGGQLTPDASGNLTLNGDTGISADVQKNLWDIRGQTRIIPLYSTVVNPGNNAQYTIVGFVGIRIMDVDLNGTLKNKRVTVQPANITTQGGTPPVAQIKSYFLFSEPWLVR
jgi:Flp pilus assembly protein TadG